MSGASGLGRCTFGGICGAHGTFSSGRAPGFVTVAAHTPAGVREAAPRRREGARGSMALDERRAGGSGQPQGLNEQRRQTVSGPSAVALARDGNTASKKTPLVYRKHKKRDGTGHW